MSESQAKLSRQVKQAKNNSNEVKELYLSGRTADIIDNVPERFDRLTIARNVAKWNLEKELEKAVHDARKLGLKDAEKALLEDGGNIIILSRGGRLYSFGSDSMIEVKE